jgi:hypothetical protein
MDLEQAWICCQGRGEPRGLGCGLLWPLVVIGEDLEAAHLWKVSRGLAQVITQRASQRRSYFASTASSRASLVWSARQTSPR